jgi:hypothetical protein
MDMVDALSISGHVNSPLLFVAIRHCSGENSAVRMTHGNTAIWAMILKMYSATVRMKTGKPLLDMILSIPKKTF